MPRVNKSDVHSGIPEQGWHKATVIAPKDFRSRGGDAGYEVNFEDSITGEALCKDWLMLEGKGNGIGIAKLCQLGAARDVGQQWDIDSAADIEGREVFIYLSHRPYKDKETGEEKMGVSIDIQQGKCGYLAVERPPEEYVGRNRGYTPPEPPNPGDDDVPF